MLTVIQASRFRDRLGVCFLESNRTVDAQWKSCHDNCWRIWEPGNPAWEFYSLHRPQPGSKKIIQKEGVLSHFAKSMGKGQGVGNEHRTGRSRSEVFTSPAPTHCRGNWNWRDWQNHLSLGNKDVLEAEFPLEWHQAVKVGKTSIHLLNKYLLRSYCLPDIVQDPSVDWQWDKRKCSRL